MPDAAHPRLLARAAEVERQRLMAAEAGHYAAIRDVESLARTMEAAIGAGLAQAVLDTCGVLRRSMTSHDPQSPAGSIIRRFLPTRVNELRLVCTDTAMMLSDVALIDG